MRTPTSARMLILTNLLYLKGHKWKSKSHLPAYTNATEESASEQRPNPDPCSPWYPGHRPFEAPEVNNIANYITTLPSLKAFVDLRSYGQMRALILLTASHCAL